MHPQSELLIHNFFYAHNRMTTAKISIRMEIEMHKKKTSDNVVAALFNDHSFCCIRYNNHLMYIR